MKTQGEDVEVEIGGVGERKNPVLYVISFFFYAAKLSNWWKNSQFESGTMFDFSFHVHLLYAWSYSTNNEHMEREIVRTNTTHKVIPLIFVSFADLFSDLWLKKKSNSSFSPYGL